MPAKCDDMLICARGHFVPVSPWLRLPKKVVPTLVVTEGEEQITSV